MKRLAKFLKILRRGTYFTNLLRYRVAAAVEHEPVLRNLKCQTVVDVGANRGQFSMVVRNCLPQANIVAFEPLAGPASKYESMFGGDARVKLHRFALGVEKSRSSIHISHRDDSSSLLPISETQDSLFPGTFEVATEQVEVAPLSEFWGEGEITRPALLKIDVQGYELIVLQGCESLLHTFAHVYVECSFIELYRGQALAYQVISWLEKQGFILSGIFNMCFTAEGKPIQADFLFSSSKNPDLN